MKMKEFLLHCLVVIEFMYDIETIFARLVITDRSIQPL